MQSKVNWKSTKARTNNLEVYKSNDRNEEYGIRLITVALINEEKNVH